MGFPLPFSLFSSHRQFQSVRTAGSRCLKRSMPKPSPTALALARVQSLPCSSPAEFIAFQTYTSFCFTTWVAKCAILCLTGTGLVAGQNSCRSRREGPIPMLSCFRGDMQVLSQGKGLSGACILGSLGTQITTWLSPLLLGVLDLSQVWWHMRAQGRMAQGRMIDR